MIEGSGSVLVTNGSGCGSGRPKSIRIHNTVGKNEILWNSTGIIALELDLLVDEPLSGEEVVDPPGLVHVDGGEAARLAQPQTSPLLTLRAYRTQELREEYRAVVCFGSMDQITNRLQS
jgi:hypothetical protein